ncbi:MAG: type transport system ATP-binding protein, partial [Frankiaceae bacterium]|nr:type transport system ATP-binding protein [Frankiaceae bacterium]
KSTLLKCIAKILRPDAGSITANGSMAALLELGSGFHPELSGRDNVFLNGAILGMSKKEITGKFDEIVAFAGLEQFIDTPVKNYSSGMYVRLGFSVAISVDPEILLVDEVLAVGDEAFQRKCSEKFNQFREDGRTVVIVSHAMSAMRDLCDEMAWLDRGVLRDIGRPSDVVDEYVDESHVDRIATGDESAGGRWGSGEALIERVELLDSGGRATAKVHTGDPVTIRFHWTASRPIARPVFGMAIHSLSGVEVTGPNTRDAGQVPDSINGTGVTDIAIERLMLVPGTYDISASLYDHACVHAYDHRHRMMRFDVEVGTPRESYGVASLGGQWTVRPNEQVAAS